MTNLNEISTLIDKHIRNSHSPSLKPKIAKELVKPTRGKKTTKRQQCVISHWAVCSKLKHEYI